MFKAFDSQVINELKKNSNVYLICIDTYVYKIYTYFYVPMFCTLLGIKSN